MKNQQDELVPTRIQNSWRVCIVYRRLNQATRKDHFPLAFTDQVLEKLSGKSHYCFLDGFLGYIQIHIAPEDQHKTTFTCPFGTFAYTRMPFGLCNALSTFQRYMTSIFSDLLQDCMEVFVDDFTIIVFSDHVALRYLLKKPDAKPRLLRWMFLLQKFDLEIKDKKGVENSMADHLSRIEKESEPMPIQDVFPDEQLLYIKMTTPWFADICNYVATSYFPPEPSRAYKDKIQSDAKYYIWDDPYLWRLCSDKVTRRCIPDIEINSILQFYHSSPRGSHYRSTRTARKVLDCGLYWPSIFRDAHQFVSTCERCQKAGMTMNRRHEMPQQPILFCEVFDVWGIEFMGPFPASNGYSYILLAVDYISRWVEAIATRTNDAKVVVDFLKSNIFCRFGVPKALISDQGSHFCNRAMASLLQKYGVAHRIAITYHSQTNSQAKVFNRKIKQTLQKMTNPTGRIGVASLKMLYGHIGLHTEHR
ncbi:hypothetical protein CR513_55623, partial [Mucuna pruriens]